MKIIRKESTDKSGLMTVNFDIVTPNGIVANLSMDEISHVSNSLKTCIEEVKLNQGVDYFEFRRQINQDWQAWKSYCSFCHKVEIKPIQETVTLELLFKKSRGNAEKAKLFINQAQKTGSKRLFSMAKRKEVQQ